MPGNSAGWDWSSSSCSRISGRLHRRRNRSPRAVPALLVTGCDQMPPPNPVDPLYRGVLRGGLRCWDPTTPVGVASRCRRESGSKRIWAQPSQTPTARRVNRCAASDRLGSVASVFPRLLHPATTIARCWGSRHRTLCPMDAIAETSEPAGVMSRSRSMLNVTRLPGRSRLVHHAEVVALKGDSYRLKDRDLGRVRARNGTED